MFHRTYAALDQPQTETAIHSKQAKHKRAWQPGCKLPADRVTNNLVDGGGRSGRASATSIGTQILIHLSATIRFAFSVFGLLFAVLRFQLAAADSDGEIVLARSVPRLTGVGS